MSKEKKNVIRKEEEVFRVDACDIYARGSEARVDIWMSASYGSDDAAREFSIDEAEQIVKIIQHEIKRAKKMNKKKEGK